IESMLMPVPRRRRARHWYAAALTRARGGIGRRAGFRFLCPQGRGGSSPPSRTRIDAGAGSVPRPVVCVSGPFESLEVPVRELVVLPLLVEDDADAARDRRRA